MNWDNYFMKMVTLVSEKSKDESTHIGAVVVDEFNQIRATGYNSFPRGCIDSIEERQLRPEKYYWFEHAERNAIYSAARAGVKLDKCKMYTSGIPCMDCARGIVQSGITEVITFKEWDKHNTDKWEENAKRTIRLFVECGVKLRYFDEKIENEISIIRNGEEYNNLWAKNNTFVDVNLNESNTNANLSSTRCDKYNYEYARNGEVYITERNTNGKS